MKKYRLVTRSDMDGLVCAVLLKYIDLIDEIIFVHPKDVQDGKVDINSNDITTNLPYDKRAYLVFDHHESELLRNQSNITNHIIKGDAKSAARVVYEYYGGREKFPEKFLEMMEAVDKADSAHFEMNDVLEPKGWEFLSFLMDSRTGLGRFRQFTVSNYNLMMLLIDYCKDMQIDEIMQLPDVLERIELYNQYKSEFKSQILNNTIIYNKLAVLDYSTEQIIYPGNRFMIYALFPKTSISIHKILGFRGQNISFAVGKSIFDRSHNADIGKIMLKYGGGGHKAAGTCQVSHEEADEVLKDLILELQNG